MAISVVHTGGNGSTGAVSSITTSNFSSTTGNLIVAAVRNGSTSTPTSVKNAAGTALTGLTRQVSGTVSVQFYYLANITGNATDNIVAMWSGNVNAPFVCAWEISGCSISAPSDVVTGATNGGSSPITSASFSTLTASEIILACATINATGVTYTAGGSYSLDFGTGGSGFNGIAGASHLIVGSIQTNVTASFSFTPTGTLGIIAVASFKGSNTQRLLPLLGVGQ